VTGSVGQRRPLGVTIQEILLANPKMGGVPITGDGGKNGLVFPMFSRGFTRYRDTTDFFTAEVWTLGGLVTHYVLFFIHLGSRKVQIVGMTPHPNAAWMV